jgi:hypothetical protein
VSNAQPHVIEVQTVSTWQAGPQYRATCDCNWQGVWRDDRSLADTEGRAHILRAKGVAQAVVNEIRSVLDQGRKIAYVKITRAAFAGSPAATGVLADEDEMQVLVHPDDWKMLAFESPSGIAATETPDLFGVPVLYDDEDC